MLDNKAKGRYNDPFFEKDAEIQMPDFQVIASKVALANELTKAVNGKDFDIPQVAQLGLQTMMQNPKKKNIKPDLEPQAQTMEGFSKKKLFKRGGQVNSSLEKYPNGGGVDSNSVVDVLRSKQFPTSFNDRLKLAKYLGINDYTGTVGDNSLLRDIYQHPERWDHWRSTHHGKIFDPAETAQQTIVDNRQRGFLEQNINPNEDIGVQTLISPWKYPVGPGVSKPAPVTQSGSTPTATRSVARTTAAKSVDAPPVMPAGLLDNYMGYFNKTINSNIRPTTPGFG